MEVNGVPVYADVATINAYITTHYFSQNPVRLYWEGLSQEDQACFAIQMTSLIDSLPLVGYKCSRDQTLELPRFYKGIRLNFSDSLLDGAIVALYWNIQRTQSDMYSLLQSGVKSYSVESSSITFQASSDNLSRVGNTSGLKINIPPEVYSLFSKYVY